ncbi:MAG: anaerobic glycerol-3-phosphate dehydrogenase subunit GlpA [Anaerobacillus sp.]|uniref:anaerobic glycerol-3-phosphate dehydrogenase subunit GlpA n=1 Tax=Anaerobacillus sp. TaxID=1872506 RepID=UPI00391A6B3F
MGQKIETDVVVIGGGVTGVGILRDLALRGLNAILVEKKDLVHGTSSRNHGLLHSGARYVVRDEETAIESYRENLILKKTVPRAIEATGGIFAKVPEDEDSYVEKWVNACKRVGIPVTEIPLSEAFKQEPYLSKDVQAVFHVPDGAIDPFTLSIDVATDAIRRGAKVFTYSEVIAINRVGNTINSVTVQNQYTGETTDIFANLVINAAGPWGEKVAALAEVPINLINNKGLLTVMNHRINKQVINRLRLPGDADIFVPAHNVTIFGTTGKNVDNPEDFSLHREELEEMLKEGSALIPRLKELRMIRAFSGSRPLYQEAAEADSSGRNVTRGMALLDHSVRDGLDGFITITGGKLTTFRYMAEKTVDLVCSKLGVNARCTTHEVEVSHRDATEFFKDTNIAPAAKTKLGQWAGINAEMIKHSIQNDPDDGIVICECEQITWAEIKAAFPEGHFNLNDIRRRTRLGMGPCQGTYCNNRVAALAVEKGLATVEEAKWALDDALNNRLKGMAVVATGQTSKQLTMMETLYRVSLGAKEEGEAHV